MKTELSDATPAPQEQPSTIKRDRNLVNTLRHTAAKSPKHLKTVAQPQLRARSHNAPLLHAKGKNPHTLWPGHSETRKLEPCDNNRATPGTPVQGPKVRNTKNPVQRPPPIPRPVGPAYIGQVDTPTVNTKPRRKRQPPIKSREQNEINYNQKL